MTRSTEFSIIVGDPQTLSNLLIFDLSVKIVFNFLITLSTRNYSLFELLIYY